MMRTEASVAAGDHARVVVQHHEGRTLPGQGPDRIEHIGLKAGVERAEYVGLFSVLEHETLKTRHFVRLPAVTHRGLQQDASRQA